jgi:hypothetical protein
MRPESRSMDMKPTRAPRAPLWDAAAVRQIHPLSATRGLFSHSPNIVYGAETRGDATGVNKGPRTMR